MRVIAGSARGHNLKMPGGGKTRPAMDRVKGSLFSILLSRLEGCRFLDLFAGSGSLGIEALSRGGSYAAFVDTSSQCIQAIRENLEHTKLVDRGAVFRDDCLHFIKARSLDPFDIVCIDPPYLKGFLAPILDAIPESSLFGPRTIFIIERQKKDDIGLQKRPRLSLIDERLFGDTVLTFFRLTPAGSSTLTSPEPQHSPNTET
ncbi:MAG: 16S rRNA (guanine(966)-N(2))-methyltransferase RsmD [Candidatus Ozemobacteraceae bacterium]